MENKFFGEYEIDDVAYKIKRELIKTKNLMEGFYKENNNQKFL